MPILMIALVALVAFGLIGFLLAAAVICESRAASRANARTHGNAPSGKHAA